MIQRRTLAFALIFGGLFLLMLIGLWLSWPFWHQAKSPPAAVPVPSPAQPYYPTLHPPQTAPSAAAPVDPNAPQVKESLAEDRLKRFAAHWAEAVATYANADRFGSMRLAELDATAEVAAYVESQRQALIRAHGPYAAAWGQTTRALSSRIVSGLPILQHDTAGVTVQALQESGGATSSRQFVELDLQLQRRGDGWVVSHMVSHPFVP